jgi:hypothetical protein
MQVDLKTMLPPDKSFMDKLEPLHIAKSQQNNPIPMSRLGPNFNALRRLVREIESEALIEPRDTSTGCAHGCSGSIKYLNSPWPIQAIAGSAHCRHIEECLATVACM